MVTHSDCNVPLQVMRGYEMQTEVMKYVIVGWDVCDHLLWQQPGNLLTQTDTGHRSYVLSKHSSSYFYNETYLYHLLLSLRFEVKKHLYL